MNTDERDDRLAALDLFVGEWIEQVEVPDAPPGRSFFEWDLKGAFLIQRALSPLPEYPDGLMIISLAPDGYLQHYFDSRGVVRLYRMSLQDRTWTLLRTEPDFTPLDFAQRFVGTISPDGNRIDGRWETSYDQGQSWEVDFPLSYTRVQRVAPVKEVTAMKKLINAPADVVSESLLGVAAAHPELRVDHHNKVIFRGDSPRRGKVGLVSGGGSGHEPLHGGFVGPGMLDAACCGEVFTSPVPDQIIAATNGVDGGAGVLHIVKNYTGDVMNFEMAAEMVAATGGTEVVSVVTDDDVAVKDSLYTVGRRGVGVTVLVEKIAGAAAEQGRSLAEVADVARRVNSAGRSMGMALTSCTVPAAGKPTFDLPEDQIELGIGIHGEPGRLRAPMTSASAIAEKLVEPILDDLQFGGGDVLAFVNGMGGTPLIELYLMYREVDRLLSKAGATAVRSLVGNYITSLDMAGCSVTLLKLDDDLLRLWDAPVQTPALRWRR